tara:strand:+ start:175 stop:369 length:195 start_codon:yes stop_codon:yes gene_type:complete
MSMESIKKASINYEKIAKKTQSKVNIDVLKKKIYQQEKKERIQGRITIIALFSLICAVGFIISA